MFYSGRLIGSSWYSTTSNVFRRTNDADGYRMAGRREDGGLEVDLD